MCIFLLLWGQRRGPSKIEEVVVCVCGGFVVVVVFS